MKRLYRPSNGSEGEGFMSEFCYQCIHENPNPELKPKCDIMTASMCFGTDEPEYPQEWCYNDQGHPHCTKFVKWDWDNDGDPGDRDNPKAPMPDNPNQLCMPFITDDIEKNTIEPKLTPALT